MAASIGLSLALAMPLTPPRDEDVEYKFYAKSGGWEIDKSVKNDSCTAAATYGDKTAVTIHWKPREDSFILFYEDDHIPAIKGEQTYEGSLGFLKHGGKTYDDGWGTIKFHGMSEEGKMPGLFFELAGKDALRDFATSDTVGLFYKDKVVFSLRLDGSAPMIAIVRKCGAEILAAHPADPFEE